MSMDRIRELQKDGTPLYIKNNSRSTVTANDDSGRLEIGPKGSETSIRSLPANKVEMPGLQKMIRKGIVEVGSSEDFRDDWEESEKASDKSSGLEEFQVTVEADKGKKDLIEKTCIVTGKTVFQSLEEVKNDKPPLHDSVEHLEREFVVRHIEKEEGGHEVTWDRVTVE